MITLVKPFKVLHYLQSRGHDCANKTVKVLEKLRNENNFNLFWDNVTAKANHWKRTNLNFRENKVHQRSLKIFIDLDMLNQFTQMNQRTFTASAITKHLITRLIASKKSSIKNLFRNIICYKKSSESSQEAAIQCGVGIINEILLKWCWFISTEN